MIDNKIKLTALAVLIAVGLAACSSGDLEEATGDTESNETAQTADSESSEEQSVDAPESVDANNSAEQSNDEEPQEPSAETEDGFVKEDVVAREMWPVWDDDLSVEENYGVIRGEYLAIPGFPIGEADLPVWDDDLSGEENFTDLLLTLSEDAGPSDAADDFANVAQPIVD